jgi:hypothetical protein
VRTIAPLPWQRNEPAGGDDGDDCGPEASWPPVAAAGAAGGENHPLGLPPLACANPNDHDQLEIYASLHGSLLKIKDIASKFSVNLV